LIGPNIQDLKDPLTADLVEKCARFHIVCAERLIEEVTVMAARKPKMNQCVGIST
jgi:hypothetical protein